MAPQEPQSREFRVSDELSLEERMRFFAEVAAELPSDPGVYLMKGERGEVLYVGKAKNLRARVRTYFGKSNDGRAQITYMLRRVRALDFILTHSEKEAIILENNLIKKHKPPYNIIFRDDKTFFHVKLSVKDEWPRLYKIRRPKKDGAKYYGPYASGLSLRETLETLQRVFPLRTCSDHELRNRTRPCLEYEIGRCLAPCVGKVDRARYGELVRQVDLYLSGRRQELIRQLEEKMEVASEAQEYERAAELRDRIAAIRQTLEKQEVDRVDDVDQDVFFLLEVGEEVWIQVLLVRDGSVLGARGYAVKRHGFDLPEILSQFLMQYYADEERSAPQEILCPFQLDDAGALSEWLSERRGEKVTLHVPQRGHKRALMELTEKNAREAVTLRFEASQRQERVLAELKEQLGLRHVPRRIECFDISHLQGGGCAASQVTFLNGEPEKRFYRQYELRGIPAGDDYAAMTQVLVRRYQKALPDESGAEIPEKDRMPDLIMVDGGKGQLRMLEEVLRTLGVGWLENPPDRIALAKARVLGPGTRVADFGRSDERVFTPGASEPVVLKQDSAPLLLLAHLRDESHRFALKYHRKLRARQKFRSVLDDVPGIGKKRRIALLKHFGGIDAVRAASVEALSEAPTMNRKTAEALWRYFHGEPPKEQATG